MPSTKARKGIGEELKKRYCTYLRSESWKRFRKHILIFKKKEGGNSDGYEDSSGTSA
jgi:hypothetical protein